MNAKQKKKNLLEEYSQVSIITEDGIIAFDDEIYDVFQKLENWIYITSFRTYEEAHEYIIST